MRMLNFFLIKEAYFSIRGSLDSNSALTCPTTSYESLLIRRRSAPTASASASPAVMDLYSNSLLEALKPKRTACSILSPVGEPRARVETFSSPTSDRWPLHSLIRRALHYNSTIHGA